MRLHCQRHCNVSFYFISILHVALGVQPQVSVPQTVAYERYLAHVILELIRNPLWDS